MKNKIVFKSQKDFVKWVTVSNMFAKSRIMPMVALKQFNSLKANQRTNIKKAFEEYDQKRRIKIPKGEIDSAWTISVMVDAHIIATEYNVDPLTVIMCLTFDEANRQIDAELKEQPIQKKKRSISEQLKMPKQETPQPKKQKKKEYER